MMRTANVSPVPRRSTRPAGPGLRILALAAILALALLPRLAAQPPEAPKPKIRPPVETEGVAAKATELRAILAKIRQEQKAARAAAAAWRREKAELTDEIEAVTEDVEHLDAGLARLGTRAADLEERTRVARREATAAAGHELALRSLLLRTYAWVHALNETGLPAGRDARRDRIVSLWRESARSETPLSTAASSLFGVAFRWLGDSRTCEAIDAVIRGRAAADRRAVSVLRIGLTSAIAVPPDRSEARTVILDDEGRAVWTSPLGSPGLIERVSDGLEVIRRRRTPEVIALPVPAWPSSVPAPPVPEAELPMPPRTPPPEPGVPEKTESQR
jgi:hypothetical protein